MSFNKWNDVQYAVFVELWFWKTKTKHKYWKETYTKMFISLILNRKVNNNCGLEISKTMLQTCCPIARDSLVILFFFSSLSYDAVLRALAFFLFLYRFDSLSCAHHYRELVACCGEVRSHQWCIQGGGPRGPPSKISFLL